MIDQAWDSGFVLVSACLAIVVCLVVAHLRKP